MIVISRMFITVVDLTLSIFIIHKRVALIQIVVVFGSINFP